MSKKKELTEEQKRKNLVDEILKKRKEGKIIFSTFDGFMEAKIGEIINNQPIDGLLYDLNRDLVTCLSWIAQPDSPIQWVNNAACGIVIEYMAKEKEDLKNRIVELENKIKKLEGNHERD